MTAGPPPLYLRSLSIENFRGIDKLELHFAELPGALLLAGDNGVGKTSVLEAALLLLGRVDLLPADTASPRELVRQGASRFVLRGVLEQGGREHPLQVDTAEFARLQGYLQNGSGVGATCGPGVNKGALRGLLQDLRWGVLGPAPSPELGAVEYFSARREPEELGAATAGPSGARSSREERRLAELKRRLVFNYKRRGFEGLFGKLDAFLAPFLAGAWKLDVLFAGEGPGSEPVVVLRDGELPAHPTGGEWTFEATRSFSAPRVVPIDRLSSGQMALLAMAYPFVFYDARPLELALIDEPEQHLHPTWQRALLDALRTLSPSTQFLVTTHSKDILESVSFEERRLLLLEGDPRIDAPPHRDAAQ